MDSYEVPLEPVFLVHLHLILSILGMIIIAVNPNQVVPVTSTAIFYTIWNLFSGLVIRRMRIAVWWRWYTWMCPVAWSLYSMVTTQYGDVHSNFDSREAVVEYLRDYFGFQYNFLWVVSVVLIGFVLLFVSVYAYAMKALNFQKR
ncbi:ABC transporter G family member 38-like [Eucalyptus grandis]|uniref:ABC transporter G family member 38-like n=1 Tax=Eucalyptus grandis TaxID=71139 RepID=UPI00192EDB89|nr:ABC transporter G family member 38-like [Eucalyptus grandis]